MLDKKGRAFQSFRALKNALESLQEADDAVRDAMDFVWEELTDDERCYFDPAWGGCKDR